MEQSILKKTNEKRKANKKTQRQFMEELIMHGLSYKEISEVMGYVDGCASIASTKRKMRENGWNPKNILSYKNEEEKTRRLNEIRESMDEIKKCSGNRIGVTHSELHEIRMDKLKKAHELYCNGKKPSEVAQILSISEYSAKNIRWECAEVFGKIKPVSSDNNLSDSEWVEWFAKEWNGVMEAAKRLKRNGR